VVCAIAIQKLIIVLFKIKQIIVKPKMV